MRIMMAAVTLLAILPLQAMAASDASSDITVRTERFPRPPYSGANYYIYERDTQVICTKLEVCNKYGQCSSEYVAGPYKDQIDVKTGAPYGTTPPVAIRRTSLAKHVCLTRFHLNKP
ncbi:hypothetical protein [Azospirillum picis]|uniref:Secreted protein n=1 Tax=Azospirillum picis TaxID=488438 RepID=A0ABU0MTF3_9PROT|nr:hypothetical protein [Azospirillum picis]MBP2302978.1 hypothetical protein [Azospirillum picis]MDQ0536730.1 hypothetical protein [Azospirillum picis]